MLVYLVFKIVPMIAGLYLSLLQWDGIEPAKFVERDLYGISGCGRGHDGCAREGPMAVGLKVRAAEHAMT